MSNPNARRFSAHEEHLAHSYALLRDARDRACKESKYDSAATRQKMTEACKAKTGLTPRDEQLDIAECLLLGLDATLIAGTGWGKTLAFALPSFVEKKKKVTIIISPLNVLEMDQAARFCSWDLPAIGLNGNTYTDDVHKELAAGAYRFIIVGPELCVDADSRFRPLLSNPAFNKKVGAVIVDEAHCITQWGASFRPQYADLDTLRALLRLRVSVLLASATMPPVSLAQARRTMHIDSENSFHLNLGNDRANISWEVRQMSGGKKDLEALRFLVPADVAELSRFPRTIIFFGDIFLSMRALRWFREQIPEQLRKRAQCYHARRGQLGKDSTFEEFRTGRVDILFATESAGMGCDIPDIELIVQFMAPESLSIWFQRAGRAGRIADIQARAILLIQPTVFHEKGKATRQAGEPVEYVKELEPGLRMWVAPPPGTCRRDVANVYFDNPPRQLAPTGQCCDICVQHAAPQGLTFIIETGEAVSSGAQVVGDATSSSGRMQPIWRSAVPATRADEYLLDATQILQGWRQRTWLALYNIQPYGPRGILPDPTLKALATRTTYLTVADLDAVSWHHAQRHGQEVLDALHDLDRKRALHVLAEEAAKRAEIDAKKEAERRERELKAQQKREEKALEKFIADQKKQAIKAQQKTEKERQRAEERARKKAERDAINEAKRVEKARQKVEEQARKAAEKAEEKARKSAEKAGVDVELAEGELSLTSSKRRREADKENETLVRGLASPKRARVDDANLVALPLTPSAIVLGDASPTPSRTRPKPKPRPVRKDPATSTPARPPGLPALPTPGPSSILLATPDHIAFPIVPPPCTPYRAVPSMCTYPTPYSPAPSISLSRLLAPATPSPFSHTGLGGSSQS